MLPNFKFGNTQNVGWYPKLRVYPIYRVIPDTPGLPEISGNTRYFGLPATRWFSKLNRVGSGSKWNTGYRVGFGYPLDTAPNLGKLVHFFETPKTHSQMPRVTLEKWLPLQPKKQLQVQNIGIFSCSGELDRCSCHWVNRVGHWCFDYSVLIALQIFRRQMWFLWQEHH